MNYTEPKVIYTCFPGGKHKVLTMSYDDGRLEDRRLVALFNRYGIRGTFHLNSALLGTGNRIQPPRAHPGERVGRAVQGP